MISYDMCFLESEGLSGVLGISAVLESDDLSGDMEDFGVLLSLEIDLEFWRSLEFWNLKIYLEFEYDCQDNAFIYRTIYL